MFKTRHRKSFCIPTPLPSSSARCPRGRTQVSPTPHTSRAWELNAAASHARSPDPAAGAAWAPRAPPPARPPPSPAPQPGSPDVGFHPCAWSFISIKGQRSAGPRLRPPPPPAALPRGARRPRPQQSARRASPAGARPEEKARRGGGGGGRLRAVLLRGGERGWGGGRGAGTPLAAAGGFASPRAATRALPASPVAAGARRKEHGEGRGGRSGARRPERGAGRAQHSAAQPSRAVTPGWSTGRARAQRLLLRRRRQVKASESARRALPAGGGRGSVGCRLGRARAFGGWVVRAETRLLRLLPGRGRRSGVGGVCLPLGE